MTDNKDGSSITKTPLSDSTLFIALKVSLKFGMCVIVFAAKIKSVFSF